MWNPSEKDKNMFVDAAEKSTGLMEDDKCGLYESSRTDSGFLSSANLTVSSDQLLSEEIKSAPDSGLIEEDDVEKSMRLDSGVDLGLSETFSGLSLKSPSLNNLNSTKLRTNDDIPQAQTKITNEEPPWKLYYRQDEEGDTQLHIAIIHGFIEVVYSLIRLAPHPCLLDILNDRSQSALHLAVLTRQARIARRLVAAGASPRARDLHGNTALHLACATGDLQAVRELTAPVSLQEVEALGLSYGVAAAAKNDMDLEQRNYDGQMCVHLAALGGHVDILRHLVWLGANINAREGKSGYTPLHQAIENGDQATTHFLLTECAGQLQLEAPTYAGRTAVQLARGSTFVQALVSRGAHVPDDDTDDEYDTDSSEDMAYENSNVFTSGFAINASA